MSGLKNPQHSASTDFRRKLQTMIVCLSFAAVFLTLLLLFFHKRYENPTGQGVAATANANGEYVATLAAVGDISLSEEMRKDFLRDDGTLDCTGCFAGVDALLSTADLTVGNFEGTVASTSVDCNNYCYPASFVTALHDAGFDILQTANTRCLQDGTAGLNATLDAMRANGIEPLGTYSSARDRQEHQVLIRDVNGIRFAFIAFTKGMNNMRVPEGTDYCVNLLFDDYDTTYSEIDTQAITAAVETAKKKNPDVIVAMLHWGSEDDAELTQPQERIAELLLDSGVNVILGSHSHIVGQMQAQTDSPTSSAKRTFIAYSLGDFLTVSEKNHSQYGCVLSLTFTKNAVTGKTLISQANYTPTYCAAPTREFAISHYTIFDSLISMRLYEGLYYDRISETLYNEMSDTVQALVEQTDSTFQIRK